MSVTGIRGRRRICRECRCRDKDAANDHRRNCDDRAASTLVSLTGHRVLTLLPVGALSSAVCYDPPIRNADRTLLKRVLIAAVAVSDRRDDGDFAGTRPSASESACAYWT